MSPAIDHSMPLIRPESGGGEAFMALELEPGVLGNQTAAVAYPAEFGLDE